MQNVYALRNLMQLLEKFNSVEGFSNIQAFLSSFTSVQSCFVLCNVIFYLWVNTFCLTLSAGASSCVPPKRKRVIEENETEQPAGTVP